MLQPLTIHGLPRSLARDAWWFGTEDDLGPIPPAPVESGPGAQFGPWFTPARLLAIAACADILFWDQSLGLSLAIFACFIFLMATLDIWPLRRLWRQAMVVVIGAAPVVEYIQPLSIALLLASLILAIVWARLPGADLARIAAGAWGFVTGFPARIWDGLRSTGRVMRLSSLGSAGRGDGTHPAPVKAFLRDWGFPLGGTMVFAALLFDANPLFQRWFAFDLHVETLILRSLFWAGVALMIYPFLSSMPPATTSLRTAAGPRPIAIGLNTGSVLRALVLFNLLIGVQTITDASILIGGADLPQGMSYASYAHRGAYPLLATALLAGAFALAANPFLNEHRALRPLMLLWLGQNAALALSALLRLEAYVAAYSLTYLRLYAMIWMGLVALSLALTGVQVLLRRSNLWLVLRAAAIACITLYVCAFINFAQVIARANLAHPGPQDWTYLCDLGPMAAGPMRQLIRSPLDPKTIPGGYRQCAAFDLPPKAAGWRDFSFRVNRVRAYVGHVTPQGPSL